MRPYRILFQSMKFYYSRFVLHSVSYPKSHSNQGSKTISIFLSYFDNPYSTYKQLRQSDPAHWSNETNRWLITKYADVQAGLRDPRLIVKRDKRKITDLPKDEREKVEPLRDFYSKWLLYVDPPDHTRLRGSINRAFTPSAISRQYEYVDDKVSEYLSNQNEGASIDLLHDFATPVAIDVVSNTLGLPPEDYHRVKGWSDDIVGFVVGRTKGVEGAVAAQNSYEEFTDHLASTYLNADEYPAGSVLGSLASAQKDGAISREEAFAIYGNILLDGHEPIANGIANSIHSLLEHPDQLDLLKENPQLIVPATEELLRFQSPFQFSARVASEDIEMYSKNIKAGEKVWLVIGSANRDKDRFENPDLLDITWTDNKHLSFAHGAHFCVGATLARPTIHAAVNGILSRFPDIQQQSASLEWQPSFAIRELKSLPVQL